MKNLKLKSICVIFILIFISSGITPIFSFNSKLPKDSNQDSTDEGLLDGVNDAIESINNVEDTNILENFQDDNLHNSLRDQLTNFIMPTNQLVESWEHTTTSENGTIQNEKYKKYKLDDSALFDFYLIGEQPEISDTIDLNYNREVIESYNIISEINIGTQKMSAIEKTLNSLIELGECLNIEISSSKINEISSYLKDFINSNDYLVYIKWNFQNGLELYIYGIYDDSKAKYIYDPVLNSFPKSYVSEIREVTTYNANNTIINGNTGTLTASIVLYTYIFFVRVDWCRINYYVNWRYTASPVVDNNEITLTLYWNFVATKTPLSWIAGLDILFVNPKYGLLNMDFYFDGTLKSTQSHSVRHTTSEAVTKSTKFAYTCANSYSIKSSWVKFDFYYGYVYFFSDRLYSYSCVVGFVDTVTGVAFPSVDSYNSQTKNLIGVPFKIFVKVGNLNLKNAMATVTLDEASLKNETVQVLKLVEGDTKSKSHELKSSDTQDNEHEFEFNFRPVSGGSVSVRFIIELQIYEIIYPYTGDAVLLGPVRSVSTTLDVKVDASVPGFELTHDMVQILDYDKFFEPGSSVIVKIAGLKNLGGRNATFLKIDFYLMTEPGTLLMTSFETKIDIVPDQSFDVTFKAFKLKQIPGGELPKICSFYFEFSYEWKGASLSNIKMLDKDPVKIKYDLVDPTISFHIVDSTVLFDQIIDGYLEIDYDGDVLNSFSYDIDTFWRKTELPISIPWFSIGTFIYKMYDIYKVAQGAKAAAEAASMLAAVKDLILVKEAAEAASGADLLVKAAQLAGIAAYLIYSAFPGVWYEPKNLEIKEAYNVDYEPDNNGYQQIKFDVNKKPLLADALGNLALYGLWGKTFSKASYLFQIAVTLKDDFGNTKSITRETTDYTKGQVEVGKVFGFDIFRFLVGVKDSLLFKVTAYIIAGVIYAIAGIWFPAFAKAAIECFVNAAISTCWAISIGCIIPILLWLDPPLDDIEINELDLENFANNSISGIGNNFAKSLISIQTASNNLSQGILNHTNSVILGEEITTSLDERYNDLENAINEYTGTVTVFNEELRETDMSYIETEEFNDKFDEIVETVNSTGIPGPLKNFCVDAGFNDKYLDSIDQPGLIVGDPSPLKNISFWSSFSVIDSLNTTGYYLGLKDFHDIMVLNHTGEMGGIKPKNIDSQDIILLDEHIIAINNSLKEHRYDDALDRCYFVESKVDQIIEETHNSSIAWYKNLATMVKNKILDMDDFVPSIYSDKNRYNIGEEIKISTEIYNIAYKNDYYSIEVIDSPDFIELNYQFAISVDPRDKSETITQQFSIPYDWHVSADVYDITILVWSQKFDKMRELTLSIEILPFHNTSIIQLKDQIALKPGATEYFDFKIVNLGNIAEEFIVNVSGVNSTWYELPSETIYIISGFSLTFSINFSIPRSNQIPPDTFIFTTNFTGYLFKSYISELIILPFYDFYSTYTPSEVKILIPGESETSKILIENLGNTPVNAIVYPIDFDNPSWFSITSPILLDIGESVNITIVLTPERIYSTTPGFYNFSLLVSLEEDEELISIIKDNFTVLEFYDSEKSVLNYTLTAEIGESVDFICNITNLGNVISDYSLLSFSWNNSILDNWTTIVNSFLRLDPGETSSLILNVEVPYFWENMEAINAICILEISKINESITELFDVNLKIESTPRNLIYFIINRLDRLYDNIDKASDSCRKWFLLASLRSSIHALNRSLYYFNMNYFDVSVILDICSRTKLQIMNLLGDTFIFNKLFNISFSNYVKNELFECKDQISLLIGMTINIALNQKIGTQLCLIQIKHNQLFRILNNYDLNCMVLHLINIKIITIDHYYSLVYKYAIHYNINCLKIPIRCLIQKYNCLLYKLYKYYRCGLIPMELYDALSKSITEIQTDLVAFL